MAALSMSDGVGVVSVDVIELLDVMRRPGELEKLGRGRFIGFLGLSPYHQLLLHHKTSDLVGPAMGLTPSPSSEPFRTWRCWIKLPVYGALPDGFS